MVEFGKRMLKQVFQLTMDVGCNTDALHNKHTTHGRKKKNKSSIVGYIVVCLSVCYTLTESTRCSVTTLSR